MKKPNKPKAKVKTPKPARPGTHVVGDSAVVVITRKEHKVKNPMLDEVKAYQASNIGLIPRITGRDNLVKKYAWAIPSEEAIEKIASYHVPIVEVGAGRGYWASLLAQEGVDVVCYDKLPPDEKWMRNIYFHNKEYDERSFHVFHPIIPGDEHVGSSHPDRALFLCWPPYDDDMAVNAVKAWKGKILFYIGENYGGCTANDEFHDMLGREFKQDAIIHIPQFDHIHDCLYIFRRVT